MKHYYGWANQHLSMTRFLLPALVITDLPKSRLLQLRPKPDVPIHFKPEKLHPLKLNVTDGTA